MSAVNALYFETNKFFRLLIIIGLLCVNIAIVKCTEDDPTADSLVSRNDVYHVKNLTRHYGGDIFDAPDIEKCNRDACIAFSSGSADILRTNKKIDTCRCQCLRNLNTFREDLNICVDDIHECSLASFVSGSSSENIPFVFLPLRGQIIYPSKEISFAGFKSPICAVSGSKYLTTNGWTDLRNPIDTDVPFRLFRDEGRTFLQWLGESDLRHKLQGRLILVHLMCRNMDPVHVENGVEETSNIRTDSKLNSNIFQYCVSFRVVGTPMVYGNNVTEVLFQSETQPISEASYSLNKKEYIVIVLCSLFLGLVYVASVYLYLQVKKRKSRNLTNLTLDTIQKSEDLTYVNSRASGRFQQIRTQIDSLNNAEQGIVKNNPLLKHYPNLNDINFSTANEFSLSKLDGNDERKIEAEYITEMKPSMVHSSLNGKSSPIISNDADNLHILMQQHQESECLPEENVQITEDMSSEDKLENMKAVVNGTMRRKLYFNPAYFEPHLLMSPPPAAIEFLTKIREVITIAKYKMSVKRYQPSLVRIPEEHTMTNFADNVVVHSNTLSQHSSTLERHRKKSCSGCPGCSENNNNNYDKMQNNSNCKNCGDKRNSIKKWLENVSSHDEAERIANNETKASHLFKIVNKDNFVDEDAFDGREIKVVDSGSSSDSDTIKASSIRSKILNRNEHSTLTSISSHSKNQYLANKLNDKSSIYNNKQFINSSIVESSKIYEKLHIDNEFLKSTGDVFNNPQFSLSSPQLSHRSNASRNLQKSRRKIEVLDQYANPFQNELVIRKLQHMPDMIHEAMAKDFTNIDTNSEYSYGTLTLPTPDYDDTIKKVKKYDDDLPYAKVPTPDYNTYGRSKQIQPPDSPIYSRKSPHHLIVDYETDSLERSTINKASKPSSASRSNSSDLSSQPSPSLSNALPLEEEVEIRHTVYDRVEGFRKDGGDRVKEKPVTLHDHRKNNYVKQNNLNKQNNLRTNYESRIKYNTPYEGSMTIEVEHNPTDCEFSTDSEQFEPDTLDRKAKKIILNNNISDWTPYNVMKSSDYLNMYEEKMNYSSLNDVESLPSDINYLQNKMNTQLVLRTNGSFRSNSLSSFSEVGNNVNNPNGLQRSFNSLREIYEAKNQSNLMQRASLSKIDFSDKGRLLTLEARHSKRQRQTNQQNSVKKIIPPDVVPFENNIYDEPQKPPIRSNQYLIKKNLEGWNTADNQLNDYSDHLETNSNISELTEVTGVSDTQTNSEIFDKGQGDSVITHKPYSKVSRLPKFQINQHIATNDGSHLNKNVDNVLKIRQKSEEKNYYGIDPKTQFSQNQEDLNSIETISSNTFTIRSGSMSNKSYSQNSVNTNIPSHTVDTKVFDVNSSTHGMQIALGLKDRVRKSKDIKNAWKKFVNIATSKFQTSASGSLNKSDVERLNKLSGFSDGEMQDESITSDYKNSENISNTPSGSSSTDCKTRSDMDSGYLSTDSNESKIQSKKLYERFNFRAVKENLPANEGNDIVFSQKNINRMQEIKESSENEKTLSDPSPKNTINKKPSVTGFISKKVLIVPFGDAVDINVYSSDDEERFSSEVSSDGEFNMDDLCESGAESVETNSVFFKNVRKKPVADKNAE